MKKIMTFLAAALLTGAAYAGGTWGENPDLYGSVVGDKVLLNAPQVSISDTPLPFGNEDLYGAVYGDPVDSTPGAAQMGVGDSYGTVLHEMDIHH